MLILKPQVKSIHKNEHELQYSLLRLISEIHYVFLLICEYLIIQMYIILITHKTYIQSLVSR